MLILNQWYERDGFVIGPFLDPGDLPDLLRDAERIELSAAQMVRSEGDFNLEAADGGYHAQAVVSVRGQNETPAVGEATPIGGVLRKVSNVVRHSPAAAQLAERQDLRRLAASLMGVSDVELAHSILWFKPARVGSAKPPHQDAAYLTSVDPARGTNGYVTFWIAVDECGRDNGCLQVSPGSHRRPVEHVGTEAQVTPQVWQGLAQHDVLLHPGWGIAFHPQLIHASTANLSLRSRRALMLRWRAR